MWLCRVLLRLDWAKSSMIGHLKPLRSSSGRPGSASSSFSLVEGGPCFCCSCFHLSRARNLSNVLALWFRNVSVQSLSFNLITLSIFLLILSDRFKMCMFFWLVWASTYCWWCVLLQWWYARASVCCHSLSLRGWTTVLIINTRFFESTVAHLGVVQIFACLKMV